MPVKTSEVVVYVYERVFLDLKTVFRVFSRKEPPFF